MNIAYLNITGNIKQQENDRVRRVRVLAKRGRKGKRKRIK
jgi:hypothetical protein